MHITPIDTSLDRHIITAMIMNSRYLREVRDMYADTLLSTDYARKVAQWCIKYFDKHGEAPAGNIQTLYDIEVAHKRLKTEQAEIIQKFLSSISDRFDREGGDSSINVELLLDETVKWFKRRDLEQLKRDIEDTVETAGADEAEQLVRTHKYIERTSVSGYNPLTDEDSLNRVFETPPEPLLFFPGAAGKLLNAAMTRDQCIGLMGPPKARKTFLLMEVILRAAVARLNACLFELGDMSKDQMDRRLFGNLTKKPTMTRYLGETEVPELDCWWCQTNSCPLPKGPHRDEPIRQEAQYALPRATGNYRPCPAAGKCKECRPTVTLCNRAWNDLMTKEDAFQSRANLARHMGTSELMFENRPNNTFTVEMIDDTLKQWKEKRGFVPDVIAIDYDATMKRERGAKDMRESYIEQWKGFRKLSQEWHCLVIPASQTDADGLDVENLKLSMFSGSVEKYQHCTGMLALHGLRSELRLGLCRLSWAMGRMEELGLDDQVVLLQHLRINNPSVASFWRDKDYKPRLLLQGSTEDTK